MDFSLNDILPVWEVNPVSEPRAWLVPILSPISELVLRLGQEDLSSVHPDEDCFLMEGQDPSLPDMAATAQPGRLSVGTTLRFPTYGNWHWNAPLWLGYWVRPPTLHVVVEPVAMYSTLVYRNMVTGRAWHHGAYSAASGGGGLRSGPRSYDHWVVECASLHQRLFYPNCDSCWVCITPPNDHTVERPKALIAN